jgi:predicted dinucleotide-binding enzyme
MNIVIVGAGNVGRALAGGWAKAGHKVTMAVRDPSKSELAELKQNGIGVTKAQGAAAAAAVIVLATPWGAVEAALRSLGPLTGKIIVDATNPLTRDFSLAVGHTDSGGETVARLAPGARVVKAFNTTGFGNMADSHYPGGKLMMMVAGDDPEAKTPVMQLATDLGFEAIDSGPLAMSRYLEPLAVVWIKCAMTQKMGRDFGFAVLRR